MKLIKVKDYKELSKVASDILVELLQTKPNAILGLATGSSPLGLYENLIKEYQEGKISFEEVRSFNLDEYCDIPKSHVQSYYSFMRRNLFDHIDINKENINIPSSETKDLQGECERYNTLLDKKNIDLQILGIGGNGHIGFNEPGTPFDSETFVVELSDRTREDNKRFFNSIDEVPKYAITMGIKNILDAKSILLVASGKNKAEAINSLINGEITPNFPASVLRNHPNVTIIIDEEASSLL